MRTIRTLSRTAATLLLLVSGCALDSYTASSSATTCGSPVPGDGVDDRAAIQCLLDSDGDVDLSDFGPGTYDVGLNPTAVSPRYGLLLSGGQTIRGGGSTTVLSFFGDCSLGEYHGIHITGDENEVTNLALDTSLLTNTEEQTHAIQIQGPAQANTVSTLWITHPDRGNQAGGDCIRIAGKEITGGYQLALGTQVVGVHFRKCDRSGIAVQRGTDGLTSEANTFYDVGDQDEDVEMTSTGKGYKWVFANNIHLVTGTPNSYFAVSLSGAGLAGTEAADVSFTGNVLYGRGLHTYNLNHADLVGNVIRRTVVGDASPAVHLVKVTTDVVLGDNVISRDAGVAAGVVVELQQFGSGVPERNIIEGNRIQQDTAHHAIYLEGTRDAVIDANEITISSSSMSGIYVGGTTTTNTSGVMISNNLVRGPGVSAVRLSGSYLGIGNVSMVGNLGLGQTYGVYCTAGTLGTPVSSGNAWPAPLGCPAFSSGI